MKPPSALARLAGREALNACMIALGVLSAGMGLHGFLKSSNFIDGGVTGVSMLASKAGGVPLSVLIPAFNLPFIALGYRQIGRAFAVRSTLAIAALSAVLATLHFPDVTPDPLLTAVFGGFFIGAGIGLAVRGGAVLDGTEVVALLVSKRSDLVNVSDVILGINVVIFLAAMAVLGINEALYSILTYVAAAKTLDFILHGIEQYTALTIVSAQGDDIRARLTRDLRRGVTVFRGKGGVTGADQDILYCVVTRLEVGRVKALAREIDRGAFIVTSALADVEGGVVRRAGHH